jgi:hypothetical protein
MPLEILLTLVFYGVLLVLFLGVVYAVTATIRRAWHPERQPPPRSRANRIGWMIFLGLVAVVLVLALMFLPV